MLLETVWFYVWGLLWAIFFITDGFDFGVGTLYPFIAKDENDKRVMINAIGPLWDGNEVWLITAGGVTFAAFPGVYAALFSAFYSPLLIILFALILRGVSFEFRNKIDDKRWTTVWDFCIFVGSVTPAVLFGVAFANIFMGVPIDGEGIFRGGLFTLLNPYGLMGGILFLLLFLVHGSLWLAIRTEGGLQERAICTANRLWYVLVFAAVAFLALSYLETPLYENYFKEPALFTVLIVDVLALLSVKVFLRKEEFLKAWAASAVTIAFCTFYGVVGLYPNMFPSSIDPAFSLTAHNAASSPLTLTIMLVVAAVFVPIVLVYQTWAYKMFSGKTTVADLLYDEGY